MSIPTGRIMGESHRTPLLERSTGGGLPIGSPEAKAAINRIRATQHPGSAVFRLSIKPERKLPTRPEVRVCIEDGCDAVMEHGSQLRCKPHAVEHDKRNKARLQRAANARKRAEA